MRFSRQSGVFMHITSLPGPHGIGDLGDGARAFVDFLADADQSMWQFCPLGPTSPAMANSPYQSSSSFAGNPLFIDLTDLVARGWLTEDDLEPVPEFDDHAVEYERVGNYKRSRLRTAFERFEAEASEDDHAAFDDFCEREDGWLEDYALFASLKDEFEGAWIDWPEELKTRDPDALAHARDEHADEIRYREFVQFCFDEQWHELADYADENGITLVGDLPIYVALDSADVWAAPEAFDLSESHEPAVVAGVPPNPNDDGQRWGNPLYDWETLRENGYDWWLDRLRRLFDLVDVTRIDHFKGFDEYWAIDANSDSPADGEWRDAPGHDFFETVERELGELPFVVEDLGFLDPSLVDLRDRFAFPGMRVPQYADWCSEGDMYQPMHYPENSVAYTSTHDTDTFVGYYQSLDDHTRDCLHYNIGADGSDINWSIIDAVWNSASVLSFTTMQDVLGLDSHARFNTPGTQTGNWEWRVTDEGLDADVATSLAQLTDLHIRN
ncbi:4-alpha-glucanotransferase [Haloferax profundi]|uniref:4-alpha-glucanotransferase n=1 Tax=Haloferax profundi TaxID=1544718 RepID=A0A0W1SWG1_9EURY|nr:4-alpha-glucanotransferase [Haloferax profundi]KTG30797.1 4-alpha-glucanotransferase [Haloferax profundi]